jgi:putative tryptophan/tyrosine transport system substrate-binding protein
LLAAKVDVIAANGGTATVAASKVTKEIPIVTNVGLDPVAMGLVASLSRPGGNITGVANLANVLNAKRFEQELNPSLSSVGVLLAPNAGNPSYVRDSQAAARARFASGRRPLGAPVGAC